MIVPFPLHLARPPKTDFFQETAEVVIFPGQWHAPPTNEVFQWGIDLARHEHPFPFATPMKGFVHPTIIYPNTWREDLMPPVTVILLT